MTEKSRKIYERKEVENTTLDYFNGDSLATDVWINKYSLKDSDGNIYEKSPDDMHNRLADEFHRIERKYPNPVDREKILESIRGFKRIIPQGSPMAGIGNDFQVTSLSNCLRGDIKVLTRDGYKSINTLAGKEVEIMTKGGGWVKAPFFNYGPQKLHKLELSKGKSNKKTIYCTNDHDWFIFKKPNKIIKKPLSELKIGDKLHLQFGKGRSSFSLSPFGVAHGITYGDGHSVKGENNCKNISLCAESRSLGKFFINTSISSNENLCEGGSDFYSGLPNFFRELPNIRENKSYLMGWLSGYFAADGCVDERGSGMLHSSKKEDILFIQDVCGVLGIGCSEIHTQTVISNLTNREHTMYHVYIHVNHLPDDFFLLEKHRKRIKYTNKGVSKWSVVDIIETDLIEDVFCAEVPETNSFVIEGNILSGNCFVIGNGKNSDSYGGIFKVDQEIAQLQKRRAGVGTDLSYIRPKGTPVKNSAITSTGVVPFMERHSNTTKEVAQDGRRGALLLSISIKHPDAENFIDAKLTDGKVTGANVSVKIDDEFMNSIKNKTPYIQRYPTNWDDYDKDSIVQTKINEFKDGKLKEGELVSVGKKRYIKIINSEKLWKKIIYNAWKSAEPGLLFWDTLINESIPDSYADLGFKTISTNPCGEIPLSESDSCRLIALNLFGYVVNPFQDDAYFNYDLFKKDVQLAQRLMDDLIDLEIEKIDGILEKIKSDPEDEFLKLYEINLWERIKKSAINGRRTGLGITGEGDMLASLNYRYGTDEANAFAENIHKILKLNAYKSSVELAKQRGPFPIYDVKREDKNPFLKRIEKEDPRLYSNMVKYGRRNIALLTIPPTGSVSIMTQTSSGIEPVFMPVYMRRRKINPQEKGVRVDFVDDEGVHWTEYPIFHHGFELWLKTKGYDITIVKTMNKKQIDEIIKKSPYYKATANDVDWLKKVEMQGMVQKHIDHSISVTVNLPNDITEETVSNVYQLGWEVGCKGMTVYRDGSRSGVLVSNKEKKENENLKTFKENNAPKRPKRLKADIHRFQNNLEKWVAVVGKLEDRPYEIFTGVNVNGLTDLPNNLTECEVVKNIIEDENGNRRKRYDIEYYNADGERVLLPGLSHAFNPEYYNYAKLTSGILRHGMPLIYVYELINSLNLRDDNLNTWKNGVARVLKRYIKDGEKTKGFCPQCGGEDFEFKEGCISCSNPECLWTKCG